MKEEKPSKETLEEWFNNPANWKYWAFYYNPQDKRIFPPKRTRLGWTIKFANRKSIIINIIILLVILAIGAIFLLYKYYNDSAIH